MQRDIYDLLNLIFNGIGATITLATAIVAVAGFVIARRSERAAAEAQRRADEAGAVADQATRNEARTYGYLERALRVVQRRTTPEPPLLDVEEEFVESPETDEERAARIEHAREAFAKKAAQDGGWEDWPEGIRGAEGPDSIETILADMERESRDR